MGILSAIGTLGAGIVGSISQNNNVNKQIAAQQKENEKNRQYNLMLAKQQNAWNLEQWNRENQYNDPSAVMSRLRNAGINPALAYSNGVGSFSAAYSPTMTAGAPSRPVDMSALSGKQTIADAVMSGLQMDKIFSESNKINSEKKGQDIDNSWKDKLNSNQMAVGDSIVNLNNEKSKVPEAQIRQINKGISKMDTEIKSLNQGIKESRSKVANMDEQTAIQYMDYVLRNQNVARQLELTAEQIGIEENKLALAWKQFALDSFKANSQDEVNQSYASYLTELGFKTNTENGILSFDLDSNKSDPELNKWLNRGEKLINFASDAIGTVQDAVSLKRFLKGRETKTTTSTTKYDKDGNFQGRTETYTHQFGK